MAEAQSRQIRHPNPAVVGRPKRQYLQKTIKRDRGETEQIDPHKFTHPILPGHHLHPHQKTDSQRINSHY